MLFGLLPIWTNCVFAAPPSHHFSYLLNMPQPTEPRSGNPAPRVKKIVHFLYEPGDGGLDRVAILLANGMADQNFDTELWLTNRDGPTSSLISERVTVRTIPTPPIGGRGLRLLLQLPALAKLIREHRPAAIFSAGNQSNLTLALGRMIARRPSTKIIQKITNPVERPGMGRWLSYFRRLRFAMTARLGDVCLTLSAADARDYAESMPSAKERFRPVYNAYVSDEMLQTGENRAIRKPDEPMRFLAVGRLAVQKDYHTMFAALAKLDTPSWHLTILGDGPLRSELEELASDLRIADQIAFEGFVKSAIPYYAQHDALILSSRWEGLPAVPLEAMACGCQVIATDCSPGLTELLAQIGQETVGVGDVDGLTSAIQQSMEKRASALCDQTFIAKYSITSSINNHLQIADQTIG